MGLFFDIPVQVVNLISTLKITSSFKHVKILIDRTRETMRIELKQTEKCPTYMLLFCYTTYRFAQVEKLIQASLNREMSI